MAAERALDEVLAAPYSEVRRVERTFLDSLMSLAAAGGLVLLVPFAILLVGVPIALGVRGLLEAFAWLFAFVR